MKLFLAAGSFFVFVSFWGTNLPAQSLIDIVSQTGKVLSKTVRSAQRALAKPTKRRRDRRNGESDVAQGEAPPVPMRRPRSWETKGKRSDRAASVPLATKPVKRHLPRTALKPDGKPELPGKKDKPAAQHVARDVGTPKLGPAPDVWSEVEINIAQARCRHLLKQVDAVTIAHSPIKKGPCGDAAPVKLVSLGRSPQVAVSPPAIVNCQMVHALYTWLENDLQPLSQKHLGAKIVTIETMSSYSCRNAYGRKDTRLSEHARANALDIGGFLTANGKRTRLLAHWGPNQRDIAAAKKKAQEKAQTAARKVAKKDAQRISKEDLPVHAKTSTQIKLTKTVFSKKGVPLRVRGTIVEGPGESSSQKNSSTKKSSLGLRSAHLGGPKSKRKRSVKKRDKRGHGRAGKKKSKDEVLAAVMPSEIPRISNTPQAKFLRAAHERACRIFGTVLGPDANEAHRNHFHVDLAPRKHGNYCR